MEQRLEGGKVPGCKFRVPTRPGAPAEKGVVLSTGSGSCPSLPARWGRPVGLSGACLGLTHSAPPRPPLRLAPGLFRGGAAGRYCVLKATAGLGCDGGVEPQVPGTEQGQWGRGTRPGLRTRLLAAAAMPWSGSRGSGRGPWRQCAAPRWLPCALCPVPALHPPSPSTRGRCSPGSCSPVLVPELTGTCPQFPLRNRPFPVT